MTDMLTQCPDCQTLFRIRGEQLRTAAGKVHCCRCNNIFNALENLREAVDETPAHTADATATDQPEDNGEQPAEISLSHLFEDQPTPERAMELYPSELAELLDGDRDLGVDIDIDVDLDQLEALENLAAPSPDAAQSTQTPVEPERLTPTGDINPVPQHEQRGSEPPGQGGETEPPLPFQLPENLPPIQPTEEAPRQSATQGRRSRRRHNLAWSLLAMVLLLSAMGQAAWIARDRLMDYPVVRVLAVRFCELAGCQLSPRRDPSRIAVLSRSVKTHPEMPKVLQILLTFSNTADFDQPYPQIRLSLYSNNNELIARRRFNAEEYLGTPKTEVPMIAAGQSVSVELALEDPGEEATGFKFDFF